VTIPPSLPLSSKYEQAHSLTTLWAPAVLNNSETQGFNQFENGYALGWQAIDRSAFRAVTMPPVLSFTQSMI